MTLARFIAIFGAALLATLGIYAVTTSGGQRLVCGLKPALPPGVRTGMGLANPTQEDGSTPATQSGIQWTSTACLPPVDAATYLLAVELIGDIGQAGAWDGLASGQCRLVRAVTESEYNGTDVVRRPREIVCQLAGPTPNTGILKHTDRLSAGRAVEVMEVLALYACTGQPAISCSRPPFSAAILNRFGCACCARGAGSTCLVGGQPGQPAREYRAADVSGTGKRMKICGEYAGVADPVSLGGGGEGLNYSMHPDCL